MKKKKEPYVFVRDQEKEVISRLERFCAYTERCEADIIKKLREWKVPEEYYPEMLEYLREWRFVDQDRYGRLFANGKFKLKGWGKQKIRLNLSARQVDETIISEVLDEMDEDSYIGKLDQLLTRKRALMKEADIFILKNKLYRFAVQKGYEPALVINWLDKHLPVKE